MLEAVDTVAKIAGVVVIFGGALWALAMKIGDTRVLDERMSGIEESFGGRLDVTEKDVNGLFKRTRAVEQQMETFHANQKHIVDALDKLTESHDVATDLHYQNRESLRLLTQQLKYMQKDTNTNEQ